MSDCRTTRQARLACVLIGLCIALAGCNENASGTAATSASTPIDTQLPVISGTPAQTTISVGQPFSYTPTAGSPTGAALAFQLLNGPAWLSINTATGEISGTPATVDIGTYLNIHIAVTDGVSSVSGPSFALTVVAANDLPPPVTGAVTISGSPITAAVEGVAWSFRPAATAATAGSTLAFRVANPPSWTTFDTTTGTLSGTPPAGSVGSYANIVISVSDSTAEAALPAFTLSVAAPRPPTIAGTPATTAQAGTPYSFRPTATDPTGNPLVYTITGKPAWAAFDPVTGTLSGTPAAADVGSRSTVTITASDGLGSATLPAYTLGVVAAVSGSATLSWVPPTTRTDGTTLTDLAGFRVYYGSSSGNYPNSISITNPKLTGYTIEALPAGTYYFVTTAFDAGGKESAYSSAVSKIIK